MIVFIKYKLIDETMLYFICFIYICISYLKMLVYSISASCKVRRYHLQNSLW